MKIYPQKYTINLSEHTAAYTRVGKGTPVIFIHGLFGNSLTLEALMQELQHDYCCIGLELLGFGDSDKQNIKYSIDVQVAFLQDFLAAMQLKSFYLVGYSYGAWVTATYAIAEAKRIKSRHQSQTGILKGVTLIAPDGIKDDSAFNRCKRIKPLLWNTKLVDVALSRIHPVANLVGKTKEFNTITQLRNSIVTQPLTKTLIQERFRGGHIGNTVENEIHHITVPTLVIAANNDNLVPLWHSQTYAKNIPKAKLEIISGANHYFHQTHPQQVASLIKKYWQLIKY
ncbi:MAG: alpha/beta hydrolase [Rivularia sp. (in: cyanobacteria)]